jgi:hypothetical protein
VIPHSPLKIAAYPTSFFSILHPSHITLLTTTTTTTTTIMTAATVHVSNIAPGTSERDVTNFFSFCGKITNISVTPTTSDPNSPLSATITFERETAAKTAVLLE